MARISALKDSQRNGVASTPPRPQDALLYDMELPLRATFYPLGFAVDILTNDPAVLLAAQESFGHRRLRHGNTAMQIRVGVSASGGDICPPEPTRREYNHLYSLTADPENHAMLDLNTCTSFVWLNRSAVKNRLYLRYNFLEKVVYLLLGASVVTDLHAACVSKSGKGILLCGDSGAGKSTLAYACARAGWTYTSDDTSYLINDSVTPRVVGHAHRMRLRPTAKDLFPELANYEVTPRMEGKPSLEISSSELPILSTAFEAGIYSIVYLNRSRSPRTRLVPLPAGTATERTRKDLFSAGEIRAKHEKILEILSPVPTFELEYSVLDYAIDELDRLVQ
jgi:energy-coupling factor transporter ATP-binding protein EcfA2